MTTRGKAAGFTLVELIVSMAIATLIAALVVQLSLRLLETYRHSGSAVEIELEANLALDQIESDLEAAILRERGGEVMFAVTAIQMADTGTGLDHIGISDNWYLGSEQTHGRPQSADFFPEFPEGWESGQDYVSAHQYGWAGAWLRFFTAAPTLNAVSYRIIRRKVFGAEGGGDVARYLLHRAVARHDKTLVAGFDLAGNVPYNDASAVGAVGNPSTVIEPSLDGYLLENVVDFGVRLYRRQAVANLPDYVPEGTLLLYPEFNAAAPEPASRSYFASTWSGDAGVYPDVVEVFLRVLDRHGAEKLRELENGEGNWDYEAIVAQHGRLFRRFVALPGREGM